MKLIDIGETSAIDECLLLYKGRLHFRQFIKTKRARFGLKLFCHCPSDPRLRGYTYNFSLYIGKDIYNIDHIPNSASLSMSEKVVVYLCQNLLDEGREIILDNWYVSVRLAEFLLARNTYITGTIRTNRGVPKELTSIKLEPGQACFVRKGDVLLVRYRDKRDVYVLSTKMVAGFVEKTTRPTASSRSVVLQKPHHIEHYNKNMGAVDAVDQDIESYCCARKNYTWFKKLGLHMIQRMVLNAKTFYAIAHKKDDMPVLEFEKLLCSELLECYSPRYMKEKAKYEKEEKEPDKHVFASNIKEDGKRRKRRLCVVCYSETKRRKYTANYCASCEKKPALCGDEHFETYHDGMK